MNIVKISTDGSGHAMGGPGGWAAVLRCGDMYKEISGGERVATNNTMELMAVIQGLRALKGKQRVEVVSDSEYVVNGASEWCKKWIKWGWKTAEGASVKNKELWFALIEQLERHEVFFTHVPGHSGNVDNERCDELAGIERLKIKDAVDGIVSNAIFSDDRIYRYALFRRWEPTPARYCNFLMLNPSTADEVVNDPTVERCERRARAWGYGGLIVTNLFGLRSTDPFALQFVRDPVGPGNDGAIMSAASMSEIVVCAWGEHGGLNARSAAVRAMLPAEKLHYLKLNKTGEPAHPLYLPYKLTPKRWEI